MYVGIVAALLLSAPFCAWAEVRINEVAWMGTTPKDGESAQAASNNEWIELYNAGTSEVSLVGWSIVADDGAPDIALSGSIGAGEFFLLERGSDDVVPSVVAGIVFPFKNNALSNSGEVLLLKRNDGGTVDTVNAANGWPGGDNGTKDTMQRSGSGWVTASPTPGRANASGGTSPPTAVATNEKKETNSPTSSTDSSSGGGSTSSVLPHITAYAGEDQIIIAGSVGEFAGSATGIKGEPLSAARYWWNFGDGTSYEGRYATHLFQFPGTYMVGLHVTSGEYAASDYLKMEVRSSDIRISRIIHGADGFIEIANESDIAVDMGGWIVEDGRGGRFAIPSKTKIVGRGSMVLSNAVTALFVATSTGALSLRYPNMQVYRTQMIHEVAAPSSDATAVIPSDAAREVSFKPPNVVVTSPTRVSPLMPAHSVAPMSDARTASISPVKKGITKPKKETKRRQSTVAMAGFGIPSSSAIGLIGAIGLSAIVAVGYIASKNKRSGR